MLTEKEKFEEELKLIEESYMLDVITKNEYEDAKKRIDSKLKRLEQEIKVEEYDVKPKEISHEEEKETVGEYKEEKSIEKKDAAYGTYDNEIIGEKESMGYEPPSEEASHKESYMKKEEEEKEEEINDITKKWEYPKEEAESAAKKANQFKFKLEELKDVPEPEEDKNNEVSLESEIRGNKKIYVYAVIILILVAISSYLFFFSGQDNSNAPVNKPLGKPLALVECNSDKDCTKEGAIGTCKNPGKENSKCGYIKDAQVKLIILNVNNCFNCESGRVLSILTGFFPNLEIENVDFETENGKQAAKTFSVAALPAYILNSSLKETRNYDKFSNAFNEINGNFVVKNGVSNANYYTERQEVPNKLDLFVKPGQAASLKAEENLKEFLKAFDGKVIFEKHKEGSKIVGEFEISTFPSFVVNNKIRFSGVQPASKIRENFCSMNNLPECNLEFSNSLI